MEEETSLKSAGAVTMQIQHNVPHNFLLIYREIESNIDSFHSEPFAISEIRFQKLGIVSKARRSDEHEGKLIASSFLRILYQIKVRRILSWSNLILNGLQRYFFCFFCFHYFKKTNIISSSKFAFFISLSYNIQLKHLFKKGSKMLLQI